MNREIPIFFTIDDSYAPFLAVALASAVTHSDPARQYRAIILHQGLSSENSRKLKALEKPWFSIELTPMQKNFEALDDRMSNRLRCDYFTLTIYFRLFIPAMFPQYDKGIYIDSDVVLQTDIARLFDTDLGENLIGACSDLSIADIPELVAYTQQAVGMKPGEYINSGVLLMNLRALRQGHFEEHFLHLLSTYHFDSIAPDQDYLNAICNGRILYLDNRWDAMPNDKQPELPDPMLIHYNLFSKPWCYDGIQYEGAFWKFAEQSGFLTDLVAYKAAYSDSQKMQDQQCMKNLVKRGAEICTHPVTFRILAEKGEKIRL